MRTLVAKSALVALLASAAVAPLAASAQTYPIKGSDTLFEVMTDAISAWQTKTSPAHGLQYVGGGSGTAESAMTAVPPTQGIGPMSRNFKAAVLSAHPGFTPGTRNVLGLDAGVIVVNGSADPGYNRCQGLSLPLDSTDPHAADANNLLALILAGKDGEGTVPACTHPDRLAALATFTACFGGVSKLEHFYRRDDSSGTTDTFKEKLKIKRFCNGAAAGTNGSNLSNQDLDPIRRACVASDATHAASSCSLADGTACTAGTAGCTQGLVVALSQPDPGKADVTLSIAGRVGSDPAHASVGYAGRTAVESGLGTAALRINNVAATDDDMVRNNVYLLSRRLFLQKGDATGDTARNTAEQSFYDWATATSVLAPGRCNIDPIVQARGFITCSDSCKTKPTDLNNLCIALPFPAAAATYAACKLNGATAAATDVCCSGLAPVSGICPAPAPRAAGYACSSNADCTSGSCNLAALPAPVCQ